MDCGLKVLSQNNPFLPNLFELVFYHSNKKSNLEYADFYVLNRYSDVSVHFPPLSVMFFLS